MLASSSRNALRPTKLASCARRSLSRPSSECVSQSKRFMSAEAGWQYGMRQRQMSAKDMTYAFRPNTSYRSPATQATALARANMELGSLVEARKDEAAFLFAAKMKEEGITPNATTYEHLLMACRNSMLAETSWAVFEDMITVGLEPTITHFHHMLMAHRNAPFNSVQKTWSLMQMFNMKPDAVAYEIVITQLCKAENLELALQKLAEMSQLQMHPTIRITQNIVKSACRIGLCRLAVDVAEAFEDSSPRRLDGTTWMKCLMASADALYADGVSIAWERAVHKSAVMPDEGCCIEVLHTCGRHGLAALASDVLRVLNKMEVHWDEHHFAPIVEAFCRQGDIKEAFGVLELMHNNNVPPTLETASPIFEAISGSTDAVDQAYGYLDDMHKGGRAINIAAYNVVVQACVALLDLQRAIGIYKAAGDLGVTPNLETYNLLFSACITASHRELGDRLLEDMVQAKIKPDARTYERLIFLCLTQPTYEDAFYYLEEMKTRGLHPTQATYEALVRKCFSAGDNRHALALEEMVESGFEVSGKLRAYLESGGRVGVFEPPTKMFAPREQAAQAEPAAEEATEETEEETEEEPRKVVPEEQVYL